MPRIIINQKGKIAQFFRDGKNRLKVTISSPAEIKNLDAPKSMGLIFWSGGMDKNLHEFSIPENSVIYFSQYTTKNSHVLFYNKGNRIQLMRSITWQRKKFLPRKK